VYIDLVRELFSNGIDKRCGVVIMLWAEKRCHLPLSGELIREIVENP